MPVPPPLAADVLGLLSETVRLDPRNGVRLRAHVLRLCREAVAFALTEPGDHPGMRARNAARLFLDADCAELSEQTRHELSVVCELAAARQRRIPRQQGPSSAS